MVAGIKNKKAISILILLAYFSLFITNAYHYHNFDFHFNDLPKYDLFNSVKFTTHTLENCIVQSTFNSIHNSFVQSIKIEISINEISQLPIQNFSYNKNLFLFNNHRLRAPPFKSF
jgi:hypothetical protein